MVKSKVHLLVDPDVFDPDIKSAKERVRRLYKEVLSFEWHKEKIEMGDIPWERYSDNSYFSKNWIRKKCAEIEAKHGYARDIVAIFVPESKWRSRDAHLGVQYGGTFSGYHVYMVKTRDNFSDTVIHEHTHCDKDIADEAGISLSKAAGVDWKKAVHGTAQGYEEYKYRDLILSVKDELQKAYQRRRTMENIQLSILQLMIRLLKEQISQLTQKDEEVNENRLQEWAQAIKGFEGWYDGSLTKRLNNPGALRYSPYQDGTRDGFAYFKTYEKGWKALIHQLRLAATGESKHYDPNMTIREFVDTWAPPHDNNDHNDRYAQHIADKLGVTIETKIKNFV